MTAALLAAVGVFIVAHRFRPAPDRCRSPRLTSRRSTAGPAPARWAATSPRSWRFRRRTTSGDPAELAAWCDQLARAVRSGETLVGAVRTTTPPPSSSVVVGTIALRAERGLPLSDAVATVPSRGDLALVLTVIRACAMSGGPAAEPLDRAAAALRARSAELADRRTQSAQARFSAIVMTILPIALLGLLVMTSASVRGVIGTPAGSFVVLVGAALNLAGWRWMRRIIDRAAR